ncbi:MAG TPA: DUF58 domain-containing protein [Pyrinomonadaceae bacterium]|jgi:uncharacterized protein (DUF58 family)|nr:DUF58 domain-containing protein [Pyrinomonadaceae bacterium]
MIWPRRNKEAQAAVNITTPPVAATTPARFLDPELLARIGSLELLARAVVEGFMSGLHRSPFTGFSTEFTEYRQYNQGDDLRYLDWRLLGRTDRYFIKKYRADTNTQCHLLVDTSASMNYASSSSVSKLQYAQFLAASVSYLLNRQQDSVGLVAFDQKVHTHVPARNRTGHMRTIFGHLSRLEAGGETRLAESLHQLAEILTRRGIVVIVSDFYDEPERLKEAFQHLRFKGHDLVAFHVLDQNELDFSFDEPVLLFEDLETQEQMPVLPDVVMPGYRARMRRHVEEMRDCAAANHVDYEMLTTKQPLDFALFSFLSRRSAR